MRSLILALTLSFFFVGCGYHHGTEKKPVNDQVTEADVITFKMVNERVIQPRCVGCHSNAAGNKGGVNLETYDSVLNHKNVVLREVVDRTMPPRQKEPLNPEQVKLITDWINQGAYEFGAPVDIGPGVSDTIITGNEEIDPALTQELQKQTKNFSDDERKAIEGKALAKISTLAPNLGASFPQTVVTEEGYTVFFVDANRVGLLYESSTDAYEFKLKVDLTENLCQEEFIKPKCNYYLDISNDKMSLRWVKHPDAAKIGQAIKMKFGDYGDTDFEEKTSATNYGFNDRFLGRQYEQRFKPDRLVCDHYDWLDPQLAKNNKALFQSWSSESMMTNVETNVNENTTTAVFEGVEWLLQSKALVLQNISRVQMNQVFAKPLVLPVQGQNSTIQYQKSDGSTCQFSFSHSIQSAAAGFDFEKNYREKPRLMVYTKPKSLAYRAFKSQVLDVFNFSVPGQPSKAEIEP